MEGKSSTKRSADVTKSLSPASNMDQLRSTDTMGSSMRPFSRSLPMSLYLTRDAVMRGFRKQLRQFDLNEQQWRTLRALAESDRIEVGELADRVLILKPSLTRILRNLQKRGLISRRRSKKDQRYAFISITPRGRALFARVAPSSEKEYARIAEKFGEDRLEQLYRLLDELRQSLS